MTVSLDPPQESLSTLTLARALDLLARRDLPAADDCFRRAEGAGADADQCAGGRWMVAMLSGKMAAAWGETDAIRERGQPDAHRFWMGDDLAGKRVMLRCLHGFGDAVQFLRYVPLLAERAASVTLEVPPRLLALTPCLLGRAQDQVRILTWGDAAPAVAPAWDSQIEVMELPYLFRTTLADLPLSTSYLRLPVGATEAVTRLVGPRSRVRVGLVWSAGDWNQDRSIPFALLKRLLHPSLEVWSLQSPNGNADARALFDSGEMKDAAVCGDGLLPLAALIAHLDMVITVDTLAAHLAGAMGRPVWLLLQHAADWRWMVDREDSPWYPSMRLFRQPVAGDWPSVVERVRRAIAEEMLA